jgi:hypothetical protein
MIKKNEKIKNKHIWELDEKNQKMHLLHKLTELYREELSSYENEEKIREMLND